MLDECGSCDGTCVVCQYCANDPETCECDDFGAVTCPTCKGEGVLLP